MSCCAPRVQFIAQNGKTSRLKDMKAKDIDAISAALSARHSKIKVIQNTKIHPADDDNLWWFRIASSSGEVQIESVDGNCPFWLEDSSMKSSADAVKLESVEQVIDAISSFFENNTDTP